MHVQRSRLGWAGNTDWTMRERRGAFYIYQQHDDQVSPGYVEDLVEAALASPDAAICFAKMQCSGRVNVIQYGLSLSGPPIARIQAYLQSMDCAPFRGLIRGSAMARTSGLLLSDFDPFDSFGTEIRFMAELALLGEFRFVPGPTYYKHMHSANLSLRREDWSDDKKRMAWACLAAWMVEVIAQAGRNPDECRRLLDAVLVRFVVTKTDPWRWLRPSARWLASTRSRALHPIRVALDRLKSSDQLVRTLGERWMLYETDDPERRAAVLRMIFERLKNAGRFDPSGCLQSTWAILEDDAVKHFGIK